MWTNIPNNPENGLDLKFFIPHLNYNYFSSKNWYDLFWHR